MQEMAQVTPWQHWAGFIVAVLFFLALDLGVFHRKAHVVKFKEALIWSTVWFLMAVGFALALVPWRGHEHAVEFATGYVIEFSLSMDNVFAIAMIFAYFGVPQHLQHRVLFWGILGALIMRGLMIGGGAALIGMFHWVLYIFGAFLVVTGFKMFFAGEDKIEPERNPVIRLARKIFPVTSEFDGQKFFTKVNGSTALTPLALVLLMVETTDLIFAIDSIPAIFAVTQKPFIVFTSNVFAILGLRSLYFLLAGAIEFFRYLKAGLSIVLIFVGAKMLLDIWYHVPALLSLSIVLAIIGTSIGLSIFATQREKRLTQKRE